ncbi:hypothetical protein [Sphingomonas sp. LR55]|uniref:hypothetical protein n=1 Tax=Sphingomonas sp. LR55 TaxID=3050231 RepID=UPI002FE168F5
MACFKTASASPVCAARAASSAAPSPPDAKLGENTGGERVPGADPVDDARNFDRVGLDDVGRRVDPGA